MSKATIGFLAAAFVIAGLGLGLLLQIQQNSKLTRRLSKLEGEVSQQASNMAEQSTLLENANAQFEHMRQEPKEAQTVPVLPTSEAEPSKDSGSSKVALQRIVAEREAEFERFKRLSRKAALGDAEAQNELGEIYDIGDGVVANEAEAWKWFNKAAGKGHAGAQLKLAFRYLRLCERNPGYYPQAARWFRAAAEQGLPKAQLMVGLMHALGRGVAKDKIETLKWLTVAARSGAAGAAELRDGNFQAMDTPEIAEALRRASEFVARPRFDYTDLTKGTGTGFFITEDGYLLTNLHVIGNAKRIKVKLGKETFPAKLLIFDNTNDLAVLKVSGAFQPLSILDSWAVNLGSSVFTVGFPEPEIQGYQPKLTKGDISSLAGTQDDGRYFQISVPVQPGNSGGPLLSESGDVVGMVTKRLNDLAMLSRSGMVGQNVNYAIKSSVILDFLTALPTVSPKLRPADSTKERKFDDAARLAQGATALVLTY